jgi:hypothetical protein
MEEAEKRFLEAIDGRLESIIDYAKDMEVDYILVKRLIELKNNVKGKLESVV